MTKFKSGEIGTKFFEVWSLLRNCLVLLAPHVSTPRCTHKLACTLTQADTYTHISLHKRHRSRPVCKRFHATASIAQHHTTPHKLNTTQHHTNSTQHNSTQHHTALHHTSPYRFGASIPQEGFFAFYRGWLPSVIGVIPYVGLNFGVYETLKAMMLTHYGLRDERDLSVRGRVGVGLKVLGAGEGGVGVYRCARRHLIL